MNCQNCGAAMKFLEGRGYFVCKYCTTFHFPDSEAVSEDGVKDLGGSSDLSCPVCHQGLVSGILDKVSVLHCRECRGILVGNEPFSLVVRTRRAEHTGPEKAPSPIDSEDLKRQLHCPSCDKVMDVHPYYGPGNVIVDTCCRCQLIWLDHGELSVIEAAPGRR